MEYYDCDKIEELLSYKSITIKPGIEKYPYGPVYTLTIIVGDVEFYKFSGVAPDDAIGVLLHHLECLLTDHILTEQ